LEKDLRGHLFIFDYRHFRNEMVVKTRNR
jgi:hypothetical protein